MRIVNVEDSRREREEERREQREAKRKAEAERLARLGLTRGRDGPGPSLDGPRAP